MAVTDEKLYVSTERQKAKSGKREEQVAVEKVVAVPLDEQSLWSRRNT